MTPLESDLVKLAKLARRKDIRPQFAALRDLHGVTAVTAKLNQCFGEDGARELLTWLAEEDAAQVVNDPPPPSNIRPEDFTGVDKWGGANVSQWPITVTISGVTVRGGNISWKEQPGRDGHWNEMSSKGKTVNGETCLVIPVRGIAGHFDYLKKGQHDKILSNLAGEGALGGLPASGSRVGFYICTINRHPGASKMRERSNVVWITWP